MNDLIKEVESFLAQMHALGFDGSDQPISCADTVEALLNALPGLHEAVAQANASQTTT
jgi:hypothetical protein